MNDLSGALNLRDQIGADRLLPLRPSSQPPGLIRWLLIAQCTIGEACGLSLTLKDWGAPTEEGDVVEEGCFGVGQAPSRVATPMARQQAPFAQYDISDAVPPAPVATPPVATPSYGAERMAHEDSMAGARVARARNAGSFAFGDDPAPQQRAQAPRAPPSGMPWEADAAPPQRFAPPPPQHVEERPGTASSVSMDEAWRNKIKNQGSSIFG